MCGRERKLGDEERVNNNNNSYVNIYKLVALYIINIKILLTTNNNKNEKVQVL